MTIRLTAVDSTVVLTIVDDGKGFDARQLLAAGSGGIGLHTMKYRARAISGTLMIESSEGKGTTVICRAPIPETESASAGG